MKILFLSFGGIGERRAGSAVPGPETLSLVTPAGWAAGLLGLVGLTGSRSFSQGGHNHCTIKFFLILKIVPSSI
jgi:hypothetical protein